MSQFVRCPQCCERIFEGGDGLKWLALCDVCGREYTGEVYTEDPLSVVMKGHVRKEEIFSLNSVCKECKETITNNIKTIFAEASKSAVST